MAKDSPDLDLYHPWALTVEDAIATARLCEQAAYASSPLISNSEGASVSTQQAHFVSANSLGFMGGYPTSRHYISCSVIAGEQDAMQRDDWYTTSRLASELNDPATVGRIAAERAVARLNGRKVKTGEFPVLFEAPLAAGLLGSLVHAASGGALYRKSSFLLDHLGKQVMPDFVNISEQPHILRGLGSASFDSDGVATKPRSVVANGILEGYFLSTYTARKLGMQTTANAGGSHNLIIQPGALDLGWPAGAHGHGLAGDRTARPGHQLRHGRLLTRRCRILGREWTDRLSGRRNYYRRQPQGDAAWGGGGRQRRSGARFQANRFDFD
jgi:PmbA protein